MPAASSNSEAVSKNTASAIEVAKRFSGKKARVLSNLESTIARYEKTHFPSTGECIVYSNYNNNKDKTLEERIVEFFSTRRINFMLEPELLKVRIDDISLPVSNARVLLKSNFHDLGIIQELLPLLQEGNSIIINSHAGIDVAKGAKKSKGIGPLIVSEVYPSELDSIIVDDESEEEGLVSFVLTLPTHGNSFASLEGQVIYVYPLHSLYMLKGMKTKKLNKIDKRAANKIKRKK